MTNTTIYPPIVAITVRGGLIEDVDSTTPVRVVVEDWDVPDWDTGDKPTSSVYLLDGDLSGPKAEKLLRVLDDVRRPTRERSLPMNNLDQLFAAIAHQHLGISTLKTRRSDALDFHDVSVWAVRSALAAAFEAGAKGALPPPNPIASALPTRFDDYEIGPCRRFREDGERDRFYYEPCTPEEADVWTLYGHIPGQGVEAIGDFETCALAEQVYARITGRRHGGKA